jgi:hypothetical protein
MTTMRQFLIAAAIALFAAEAQAATCDDVTFADTVAGPGGDLVLNGLGIRKATLLKVHVYVAALYLPAKSGDGAAIVAAQPWALDLHFVHDVDASDMEEAFRDGFKKAGADETALKPRIDQLVAMFVDFKEGQVLTFATNGAGGVDVALDGASKGGIEGKDFASALLGIWLGSEPPNEDLKSGLLGGACD